MTFRHDQYRRDAAHHSTRHDGFDKDRKSCSKCPAAARFREAYDPVPARIFLALVTPAGCSTGRSSRNPSIRGSCSLIQCNPVEKHSKEKEIAFASKRQESIHKPHSPFRQLIQLGRVLFLEGAKHESWFVEFIAAGGCAGFVCSNHRMFRASCLPGLRPLLHRLPPLGPQ